MVLSCKQLLNETIREFCVNCQTQISEDIYMYVHVILANQYKLSNYLQLVLQSAPNQLKIFSIQVSTTALIYIYTRIYCNLHPGRFQELLKYMSIVRCTFRCQAFNLDLKHYEEQFHLHKTIGPTGSWATVDSKLWLIFINENYSTG